MQRGAGCHLDNIIEATAGVCVRKKLPRLRAKLVS
jgi:hypothetical protein